MKYILNPIFKVIGLAFTLFVMYPIAYISLIVCGLWDFKFEQLKTFQKSKFSWGFEGERYYIYQSIWDWFLDRKKYPYE